jgi:uncharacterized membrane protein YphA (DoxX/SURF4 family)
MKKINIFYWIVTVLFAAFMIMSGVPDALSMPDAIKYFDQIDLPAYLLPFLGVAKILGAIAILIPGFPRIKEWAYAGLMFDLFGAAWCNAKGGQPMSGVVFMVVPIGFGFLSYFLYHRRRDLAI